MEVKSGIVCVQTWLEKKLQEKISREEKVFERCLRQEQRGLYWTKHGQDKQKGLRTRKYNPYVISSK